VKASPFPALVAALTFYCLGATFFESFVNYRTWPLLDGASFPRYHAALTALVVRVMLIPIAITFAASIGLLVWTPAGLARPAVVVSVALQAIAIASSALVQIPIQMQLRRLGPTEALMSRLVWTDLVGRKLPLAVNALVWLRAMTA
jgi:hypothetical protein